MILPVDPTRYAAFLGVMAVMAITPGPANLFAIATGARKGRLAALAGVAGMNGATLVWFGAAALGLGALVATFPRAFHLLAYAGAVYIGWLGLSALRAALTTSGGPAPEASFRPGGKAFLDGFAVQIANPKALLFFTAVLPPFLDPARPAPPQLAAFAAATLLLDAVAMSAYGLGGAVLARRFAEPGFRRGFSTMVGLLLLAAAFMLAGKAALG